MKDKKLYELSDEALDAVTGGSAYYQMNEETGQYDVIDKSTGNTLFSFSKKGDALEKTTELNRGKKVPHIGSLDG